MRSSMFGRLTLSAGALCLVGWGAIAPVAAQPKSGPAQAATPTPQQSLMDACYAAYGLTPAQKIKVCSDAISSGTIKGVGLALVYYSRAAALANTGDQKAAAADYKQALRLLTDVIRVSQVSAPILFQRGLIYHTLGDADQAIVDYSDAIRAAPRETYALVNRGIVLYTKKDNNEGAIADFNAALKINPREVQAWINRGMVYVRKGDFDQAIADFTEAIKILGNPEPIKSASASGAPDRPPPTQAALQGIQAASQAADAYYQRGLVWNYKKQYDKAIADFNSAIRINPTSANHFVGRAAAHMNKEEFRPAIADFTEAIRLAPGDEYTYLQRGIAYHSVNEPDNAIADYTEAHKINPLDVNPLINRGIVYYSKKGLYDEAIADFTEVLRIDRKEINALINRGISWREKGDPDKAVADFSEALRLGLLTGDVLQFGTKDPEAVRHWDQVAHARYQRGTAYVTKKEYDLALADFNESLRLNPKEARAFVARGGIYLYRAEYKRAIADFDEALKLSPKEINALVNRGVTYRQKNDPDRALVDFNRALKSAAVVFINRAVCC